MSEPKQRWIHYEGCHEPEIYQSQEDSDKYGSDDDHLHMIEFVAYEQVVKERDELVLMNMGLRCKLAEEEQQIRHLGSCHGITQLNIALEALKFYADQFTKPTWASLTIDGGTKAREAIAKIERTK